ncbi:MAG: glycosyltransferase family 4 protein [Candidatus Pacebacteria bacterium]|nr:glycosyltransferase family 4 protein [Candidatus Paceibacterota bacterium]
MDFYKDSPKLGKKRALIFSMAYVPFVGGAELAVKEITDRIEDFGWDLVTLRFDKNRPKFEKIGNVNVYRIGGGKLLFPFLAFCKGLRLNRKNKHDVVWSIMANRAGFAALFFKFFNPKVKFLLTLQEGDNLDYPEKRMGILKFILNPFFRGIFKRADHVQAISNFLADWAKEIGIKTDKIEVVPNGVSLEKHQGPTLMPASRSVLDVESKKIIITTSRLVHKNGVDILIKAAARLKALIPDSSFVIQILGAGPEEKKLKDLAKELGVEDIVKFLGHVDPEKIPEYLNQADMFVRASRTEGLGSSFLEAMGAGLPVIGTPAGGIVDFLKDGETGLLAAIDNPDDLADKIKTLLENKELAAKIAENGRRLVVDKYSWESVAARMKDIFVKLWK